jgi:hypothetical protein
MTQTASPERSASGMSHASFRGRRHQQTKAQADRTLAEIRHVWPKPSDEAEYQPGTDSKRAEAVHWHKLLKSGIAASRIQRAALHFLNAVPDGQWPRSLASFLAGHLHDYLDPDQPDLYIPPDGEPVATNDNRPSLERKVSGIDWENDPPF